MEPGLACPSEYMLAFRSLGMALHPDFAHPCFTVCGSNLLTRRMASKCEDQIKFDDAYLCVNCSWSSRVQARVEAAGGQILFWNGVRVMGVLAVSRAIGDHCLRPYVIADPEVIWWPIARFMPIQTYGPGLSWPQRSSCCLVYTASRCSVVWM